jgi:hypothetical protein
VQPTRGWKRSAEVVTDDRGKVPCTAQCHEIGHSYHSIGRVASQRKDDISGNIISTPSKIQQREIRTNQQRTDKGWPVVPTVTVLLAYVVLGGAATGAERDKDALIRDALSAAPPTVASTAAVMTMDNNVLKQSTGAYVCIPTASDTLTESDREPMFLDKVWLSWFDALMNKKPFTVNPTAWGSAICWRAIPERATSIRTPLAQRRTTSG